MRACAMQANVNTMICLDKIWILEEAHNFTTSTLRTSSDNSLVMVVSKRSSRRPLLSRWVVCMVAGAGGEAEVIRSSRCLRKLCLAAVEEVHRWTKWVQECFQCHLVDLVVCISNNSRRDLSVDVSINNSEIKMGPKKPNLQNSSFKEVKEVKEEEEEMIIWVSPTFSIKASNKVNLTGTKLGEGEQSLKIYKQSLVNAV